MDDRNTVRITGSKNPVSISCASFAPECLKSAFYFAANKNQVSISVVYVFSIHNLLMPKILDC